MEQRFNKEDELMKKILKEAGSKQPSADFRKNIMMKIQAQQQPISPYESLISKTGWIAISGVFVLSILGLVMLNMNEPFSIFNGFEIPTIQIKIPQLNLSQFMLYGIASLSLFFLEIPFLKRWLEKH